ncbi:uncharacterized protein LOC144749505 [Ciona intestinalis]
MIKDYEEKKKFMKSMMMVKFRNIEDCLPVKLYMEAPKHLPEAGDIVYALKSFTKPHKLRLYSYDRTTTEVWESLFRGVHSTTTTITMLAICDIEMKDSLMESLLLHLDALKWLRFDDVTNLSPYMESLSNAINQRSNKVCIFIPTLINRIIFK